MTVWQSRSTDVPGRSAGEVSASLAYPNRFILPSKVHDDIHSSILLVNNILPVHQLDSRRDTDITLIARRSLASIHTAFQACTGRAPRDLDTLVTEDVAVSITCGFDGLASVALFNGDGVPFLA